MGIISDERKKRFGRLNKKQENKKKVCVREEQRERERDREIER